MHSAGMKTLTRDQIRSRKEQAVRFVRDVLDDSERADEITEESLDDYAHRRKIMIANPQRTERRMANIKTRTQLQREVSALKEENEELQNRLDEILEIAAPEDEDGDEEGDDSEEAEETDED